MFLRLAQVSNEYWLLEKERFQRLNQLIFYHNAFASAEVQIEVPEEGFLGNSAENILSSGFGVENNEAFVFYIENNEIIKTNKNFEEREVLLDSQGATRMN